jgi:transposase
VDRAETGTSLKMPKTNHVSQRSGKAAEVISPPPKRRKFSPAEKLRIVREAAQCNEPGEIGALLRREGIHSSHLSSWRQALEAHGVEGMASRKRGRKAKLDAKDHRIAELERKLQRTEKELAIAQGLLEVQKKVSQLLGVTLPGSEKP